MQKGDDKEKGEVAMGLVLGFDVARLPEIRRVWAEATKGMTKAERLDFAKWIESLKETPS